MKTYIFDLMVQRRLHPIDCAMDAFILDALAHSYEDRCILDGRRLLKIDCFYRTPKIYFGGYDFSDLYGFSFEKGFHYLFNGEEVALEDVRALVIKDILNYKEV